MSERDYIIAKAVRDFEVDKALKPLRIKRAPKFISYPSTAVNHGNLPGWDPPHTPPARVEVLSRRAHRKAMADLQRYPLTSEQHWVGESRWG